MSIFIIFKNNLNRLLSKKALILMAVIFIPLMVGCAVYFTGKMDMKGTIAIVSKTDISYVNNKYITFEKVNEKPRMSDLMLNKYVAIVEDLGSGNFNITSIKGEKFDNTLKSFLENPGKIQSFDDKNKRGIGTNILGFLIMIILIQEVALMSLYPEDRDIKTFKRILIAPVSSNKYLLAQGLFDFIIVYVPTFLTILLIKGIFNLDIGFTTGVLAILLALITLLGTAFALFMTSIIDDLDNSLMAAQVVITITSILAGSFYSFADNNKVLDVLIKILPQKQYLTLIQNVENKQSFGSYEWQLVYVLGITLVMFVGGTMISKKNLKCGKY